MAGESGSQSPSGYYVNCWNLTSEVLTSKKQSVRYWGLCGSWAASVDTRLQAVGARFHEDLARVVGPVTVRWEGQDCSLTMGVQGVWNASRPQTSVPRPTLSLPGSGQPTGKPLEVRRQSPGFGHGDVQNSSLWTEIEFL
jgi:hypothetical protein